ncbi:MAG: L-rhamnonate dehydratase, partial [Chloroflexi bacterium]|nr:L-rhamnonate dehydratase [Chloroflexota bacterium]
AVDLALWDLKGKLLDQPVYALLGGPVRDRTFCYATGNDTDWQLELGFQAMKLARPSGPVHGEAGMARTVDLIERTRKLIGDSVDLMLDCWMAYDVEYTVRLAERLRPYRLKWMEEYLVSEDFDGYAAVRERLPWMTLTTGEHHHTPWPFFQLAARRSVDVFQPDIHWVGGLTACVKIAHIAAGAGLSAILHAGGNDQYGLHFTCATPNAPWAEFFVGSPPGVPLEETADLWHPLQRAVPRDSSIAPAPGPGFGLAVEEEWLTPAL